jgi:hypothetical protein
MSGLLVEMGVSVFTWADLELPDPHLPSSWDCRHEPPHPAPALFEHSEFIF